jgi:xanthine dehydrogenase YagR molybdenum-binding subunit
MLDRGGTGLLLNRSWVDYRIPTALDVPADMEVLPVDLHDRECNHTGCKGIGEPATIPTAPAVANAVHHATGVRFPNSPVTPAKVVAGIADQRKGD